MANFTYTDAEFYDGRYVIKGTSGDDHISTLGSNLNYEINALQGENYVETGSGDDILWGFGNTTYVPGAGNDIIFSGTFGAYTGTVILDYSTEDVISYIDESNGIYGRRELQTSHSLDMFRDVRYYQFTDQTIHSSDLDDLFTSVTVYDQTIDGTSEDETFIGDAASDELYGYGGDDTLIGMAGPDTLIGHDGDDTLIGGDGADRLEGGSGNNVIDAGANGDNIYIGDGNNIIDGGEGKDTLYLKFRLEEVSNIQRNYTNNITIEHNDREIQVVNVEEFVFSSGLFVSTGPVYIDLDPNTNTFKYSIVRNHNQLTPEVFENIDDEKKLGTAEDDVIIGGAGNDSIDGSEGYDIAKYLIPFAQVQDVKLDSKNILTIVTPTGTDSLTNIEAFEFIDQTLTLAQLGEFYPNLYNEEITASNNDDFISAGKGDDIITPLHGNDVVDGGEGVDTLVLNHARNEVISVNRASDGAVYIVGPEEQDYLIDVEFIEFKSNDGTGDNESFERVSVEELTGTNNTVGSNQANENQYFAMTNMPGVVDGGVGTDTINFYFNRNEITSASRAANGEVTITTESGEIIASNIEQISFLDNSQQILGINQIITVSEAPSVTYQYTDGLGNLSLVSPSFYNGAVSFLTYELLGNDAGEVLIGSTGNDFINLLAGDDAASGGAGQDVLDGGQGSNFLTGGEGSDVFFLDARSGFTTWSTITDFQGDQVNIWGWVDGLSTELLRENNAGAQGYEGATIHYDLNNDGAIDTSITFSGLSFDEITTPSAEQVSGQGYLLFI